MTLSPAPLRWTWTVPRPPWMVIGVVTTAIILCLGTFLISAALTRGTPYEQLGFMMNLVVALAIIGTTRMGLRRKIIRQRIDLDDQGLRWTNLNLGHTRRIDWEAVLRYETIGIRRRGSLVGRELRIWTSLDPLPLVIHQPMVDGDRGQDFERFQQSAVERLRSFSIPRR